MSTSNSVTLIWEYQDLSHLNVQQKHLNLTRLTTPIPQVMSSSIYLPNHFDHCVCTFSTAWFKSAV